MLLVKFFLFNALILHWYVVRQEIGLRPFRIILEYWIAISGFFRPVPTLNLFLETRYSVMRRSATSSHNISPSTKIAGMVRSNFPLTLEVSQNSLDHLLCFPRCHVRIKWRYSISSLSSPSGSPCVPCIIVIRRRPAANFSDRLKFHLLAFEARSRNKASCIYSSTSSAFLAKIQQILPTNKVEAFVHS